MFLHDGEPSPHVFPPIRSGVAPTAPGASSPPAAEADIEPAPIPWTTDTLRTAAQMRRAGHSDQAIGDVLGIDPARVTKMLGPKS